MNILFIYKSYNNESLGPMIISSILRRAGFSTEFVGTDFGSIKRKLKSDKKYILAFSTPTIFCNTFLDLNRKLKSQFPGILSLFGGPHPTFYPEMIEEEGVDGVCIGEGEYAMLELVKNLSEGKPITHIQNWWIKQDGRIYKNPLRPLIEDLDSLPFPDRGYSNNIISFKMGRASVITSRGCPYKCSYCFNHAYNRLYNNPSGRVRRRSVDNVIEEIRQLKQNYQIKFINFIDDTFILLEKWVEEFSYQYRKEIRLPFVCKVRPNLVTPHIVNLLKEAGCRTVSMGIECGNDYVRNEVLRRQISKEEIIKAAKIIKKAGIYLCTYNLIGIPNTTLDTDKETLKLNIQCKPHTTDTFILIPYQYTGIGNNAKKDARRYSESRKLKALFTLIVKFPFLYHLTGVLMKLPLAKFGILFHTTNNAFFYYLTFPGSKRQLFIRSIRSIGHLKRSMVRNKDVALF